jgi:glyoxylase-like metal-dependent hydrolase (beta-lactamase superfamily II)
MNSYARRFVATLVTTLVTTLGSLLLLTGMAPLYAGDAPSATAPAPAPLFKRFKIGHDSAIALKDGTLQEPNDGKSFLVGQPTADVGATLQSGGEPADHFDFSIQPLLVRAKNKVLLFDTGAGTAFGPIAGHLTQSLTAAGIAPASVTDIFISHAHGDHVGGLTTASGGLAFPNATVHISAPEWRWLSGMTDEDGKKFGLQQVGALVTAIRPKVVAFEPGAVIVPGVVKAVEIKGHTPGHTGFLIGYGTHTLLFIGDAMHSYVVSVRRPEWKVAFDNDQDTAAASRSALLASTAASGQRIYAVHFPFPGIGKIVRKDDAYAWVPESPTEGIGR